MENNAAESLCALRLKKKKTICKITYFLHKEKYWLGLIMPQIFLHYTNIYQMLTMCKTLQDHKDESDITLILKRERDMHRNSYKKDD